MKRFRNLIQRNERWLMLALLIVILVIFTVTDEIITWIRGGSQGASEDLRSIAGSFDVLPGDRVDVTYEQYNRAREQYDVWHRVFSGDQQSRIQPSEVWTYLLLTKAAEREGITVSNAELVAFLRDRIPPETFNDRPTYARVLKERFGGLTVAHFEEAVRAKLITDRVRSLYQDSFLVAPPASREEMVKQYTSQNIEFTRVTWGALDASKYLAKAGDELKADADPDKTLKEFFERDPSVKADTQFRFRHPRRWRLEVLYAVHRNFLTEEAFERLLKLFRRAFPDADPERFEGTDAEERSYYSIYTDRILAQANTSLTKIEVPAKPAEKEEPEDGAPNDQEPKDGEPKKEGEAPPANPPAPPPPGPGELEKARFERGFEIVREQVRREIRIRKMFEYLQELAKKEEKSSLSVLFERLQKVDDPAEPVCGTEPNPAPPEGQAPAPGGPLIVLRIIDQPLSGEELESLEDTGIRFTHNFRHRITATGEKDLPKLGPKADVLGTAGDGRMIWRVLSIEQERRKTFAELTAGERDDLRNLFFLPDRARARARDVLEAIRKKAEQGEIATDGLRTELEGLGARFYEDEAITATYDPLSEPDRRTYWPTEYLHMRDRFFLRGSLARVLGADRVKNEIKPGAFLEVQVDSARADAGDPGAAYLVLLLDRQRPTARTMPLGEFDTFMSYEVQRRLAEDRDRWTGKVEQLQRDFNMEFRGDMAKQIETELSQRREAEDRSRG